MDLLQLDMLDTLLLFCARAGSEKRLSGSHELDLGSLDVDEELIEKGLKAKMWTMSGT